jgi:type IV pilus assembly protein PilM
MDLASLLSFKSKKGDLIGLDIGSHSVKLVELASSKGGHRLKRFAMAPLPPDVIVDGAVMDSGSIIEVVRDLLSKNKIKNRRVALSISGFSVIIKKVTLNFMSEEELMESIQWEAAQYIPFDIEEVNIDFQILGENAENPDQMDVLLVAAKKEIIGDYETLMTESGLESHIIDVDSFAVETMYENLFGIAENEVIALINIGASTMNFNIVKGPISLLTRDVSMGGKQVTEDIQKQYNLRYEEAEALKLAPTDSWGQYKNFDRLVRNACEMSATEIQRSLDFFYANYPDEHVARLGLCGGAAKTPGLLEHIQEKVGVESFLINPFERISFSPKEFEQASLNSVGPIAAVGVGLAMRRVGDK